MSLKDIVPSKNLYSVVNHYDGDRLLTQQDPRKLLPQCPPYHVEILDALHGATAPIGLHFIVTWDSTVIPISGDKVIVLLLGDERSQIPAYAGDVLAVFRNGTQSLQWPQVPWKAGFYLWLLKSFRLCRDLIMRASRRIRLGVPLTAPCNVFTIPLGPSAPLPDTQTDFADRVCDLALYATAAEPLRIGTIAQLGRPKTVLRTQAFRALELIKKEQPGLVISMGCDDNQVWGKALSPRDYATLLFRTKVCPCPGGNFMETFRHYEAARAGCVIVSDPPPNEWYFKRHPFLIVNNWDELPEMVTSLFATPDDIKLHAEASRKWWENAVSPKAVASYILQNLLQCVPDLALSK